MEPLEEKKASEIKNSDEKEETTDGQPKHSTLNEEGDAGKTAAAEVVVTESKHIKNIASSFLSQKKVWDEEEHFKLPADILHNIINELGF